jgi:hypothetical protein
MAFIRDNFSEPRQGLGPASIPLSVNLAREFPALRRDF